MYYVDKYVGMVNVSKGEYQSVGLCALFIASKLELSGHPGMDMFLAAMDGSIGKEELFDLERKMVIKLKFRLNPPTLYQYMVLLISLFNHYVHGNVSISSNSNKATNNYAGNIDKNNQILNIK